MEGTTLGPYAVEGILGTGGMGTVHRARLLRPAAGLPEGAVVALKVVHPHLLRTEGFFKRFLREAEVGRAVRHPNVVRTFDCDQILSGGEPRTFLVMEFVEGRTLRQLLEEIERLPEELCRHVGREVCRGIAAIHAVGAVHRDLKPENVLITADHVVKVMDLGVARLQDEVLRLSPTGGFVGSIAYAAPECFRRELGPQDHRVDLHALGLLLYEAACGDAPYDAPDIPGTIRRILNTIPRRLGEVNPQVSPFLEEVVHNLLEKAPGNRFPTADHLLPVLEGGEESAWWVEKSRAIRRESRRPLRRIRIPRETAVHGRDGELERLASHWDAVLRGEGRAVLVEGEAGIGKSRLADEFVGRLQTGGADLHFLFGAYPPGGAATASGAFSTAYNEEFGEEGAASWLPQVPLLVPAFDALLRGDAAPRDAEPLTRESLHTCFVHATRNLAADRPTVVLVDDLHLAPEEGRALFAALALAVAGHRILLLGTARPGLDQKWLAHLDRIGVERMTLGRLGPRDLAALLEDGFRSEVLALELAGRIGAKSDGNPFFVFEILRGLRDGQFLSRREDGTWAATRVIGDIEIPSSVLDLVNARVADLDEGERNLLDIAACAGFEFDPLLVGEVAGMGRVEVLQALGRIEKRHRLVRSAGRHCVFDHHQVQEALHGSLSELLREEYHGMIAAALEGRSGAAEGDPAALDGSLCVDLCDHLLAAGEGERAHRYLAAALVHLERGWVNDRAIALATRALAAPGFPGGRERAEVLVRKANRLDLLGRREDQETALAEAVALADTDGDPGLRARARRAQGVLFYRLSRHDAALERFRSARELAREAGDLSVEAAATGNEGSVHSTLGNRKEARNCHERALLLAREAGDGRVEAGSTLNLGSVAWTEGRLEEARGLYERCLGLTGEGSSRQVEVLARGNLASLLLALGHYHLAREEAERSLALSREIGDREGETSATGDLGGVLLSLGLPEEARERFERAVVLSREIGALRLLGTALSGLGNLEWNEGRTVEAEARYREAVEACAAGGHRVTTATCRTRFGALLAALGREAEARGLLEEGLEGAVAMGAPSTELLALAHLSTLPGGDAAAALDAVERLRDRVSVECAMESRVALFKATGDPVHGAEARRILDGILARAPEGERRRMTERVRLHREAAAAAGPGPGP